MRRVLLFPATTLFVLAAACGGTGANDAPPVALATATPEVTAGPTLEPSKPFDPGSYINGAEAVSLINEVGPEKPFPPELSEGSPELPLELAREIAFEFIADTRIVLIKEGLRGENIELIVDFCDNGIQENVFVGKRSRELRDRVGSRGLWSIEHTEQTLWNAPYVTGTFSENRTGYVARGWDAASSAVLRPPGSDGRIRFGSDPRAYIRVFDHPACPDPQPVLRQSAEQWAILGLEKMVVFPEELTDPNSGLDSDTLVRIWDEVFHNLISFSNVEGYAAAQYCGDHTGIALSPYAQILGKVFDWRIEDGSDVWPNAIWIVYSDPGGPEYEREFLFLGPEPNSRESDFRQIVAATTSDCSIEAGLELVENIRESYGR